MRRLLRGPFAYRDFSLLYAGQVISSLGDQIFPIAVAVKVLDAGGDAGDLGVVLACRILAVVAFALAGGVWADRVRRTTVMISADALRGLAVLGLALTPGSVPLWVLGLLVFTVGGGEAFFRPAYGALLPSVLPESQLASANAATTIALRAAAIFGPAVAGMLVGLAGGVRVAFVIDAVTFGVSLVTLLGVREPALTRARGGGGAVREALEGIRAVRARPWIGAVVASASVQLMLSVAPVVVLTPIVARARLGGDTAYGLVLAAEAVGGVVGAVLAARIVWRRPGLAAQLAVLPWAGLPVALALPVPLWGVMLVGALAGLGLDVFLVNWSSALQREVPRDLLARVISLDWLCSFALMPLGLALTGTAVDLFGRSPVLYVASAVVVVSTLLSLLVPGVAAFSTGERAGEVPPSDAPTTPDARPHPAGLPDVAATIHNVA